MCISLFVTLVVFLSLVCVWYLSLQLLTPFVMFLPQLLQSCICHLLWYRFPYQLKKIIILFAHLCLNWWCVVLYFVYLHVAGRLGSDCIQLMFLSVHVGFRSRDHTWSYTAAAEEAGWCCVEWDHPHSVTQPHVQALTGRCSGTLAFSMWNVIWSTAAICLQFSQLNIFVSRYHLIACSYWSVAMSF